MANSVSQSYDKAMIFNTVTNTWGVQTFHGEVPLKRILHTTTLCKLSGYAAAAFRSLLTCLC